MPTAAQTVSMEDLNSPQRSSRGPHPPQESSGPSVSESLVHILAQLESLYNLIDVVDSRQRQMEESMNEHIMGVLGQVQTVLIMLEDVVRGQEQALVVAMDIKRLGTISTQEGDANRGGSTNQGGN